jgi:hypothetical protein
MERHTLDTRGHRCPHATSRSRSSAGSADRDRDLVRGLADLLTQPSWRVASTDRYRPRRNLGESFNSRCLAAAIPGGDRVVSAEEVFELRFPTRSGEVLYAVMTRHGRARACACVVLAVATGTLKVSQTEFLKHDLITIPNRTTPRTSTV